MGKSYKQAVNDFKQHLVSNSGYQTDDSGWTDYAIIEHILTERSAEFYRIKDSKKDIASENYQTLPFVELQEVDAVDLGIQTNGCYVMKSINPLPRTIAIESLTTIDGGQSISKVKWSEFRFKQSSRNRKTRESRFFAIKDEGDGEYLYVYNENFLKAVTLTALFEDPYQALIFPTNKGIDKYALCNPWKTDIKIDRQVYDRVLKLSWSVLPQLKANAPVDTINDSSDNSKTIQPNI